ncbi:hypothetical protein KEM55_002198 [Ascosphaera atra]|nr:hypothetical protein KEM55_002198 [Ascosphaera atra]
MNYPRDDPKQQSAKNMQNLQLQPTQVPTMAGDMFSGLPVLENAIEIDDDDEEADEAAFDLTSPVAHQPQVAPSMPSAAVAALRSQLGGGSADAAAQFNPRKLQRNAVVDLEDILDVSQKRITANERTAIEVAKMNAEAMEKVAKEGTQRHQATIDALNSVLHTQQEMLDMIRQQQQQFGDLFRSVMDKR